MPRIPRPERRAARESDILRAIMLDLGREPDTLVIRNNVGRAVHVGADGTEWTVPYGLGVGSPDLLCVTAGHAWGIEVKPPGKRCTPDQLACHARWARHGLHVTIAHNVAEAREALTRARAVR